MSGGLSEGPSRGSQQGRHTGSCQPHTGGAKTLKSPPLPSTGMPDQGIKSLLLGVGARANRPISYLVLQDHFLCLPASEPQTRHLQRFTYLLWL